MGRQMIRDEVTLKLAILDNVTYDSRPEDLEALLHLFRGTQFPKVHTMKRPKTWHACHRVAILNQDHLQTSSLCCPLVLSVTTK